MTRKGEQLDPAHAERLREGFERWLAARRGDAEPDDWHAPSLPEPTDRWLRERFDVSVPRWREMGADEHAIEELMVAICVEVKVRQALRAVAAQVEACGVEPSVFGHLAALTDALLAVVPELGDPRELCDRLAVFVGIGLIRVPVSTSGVVQ